jgi:hypothetical protein
VSILGDEQERRLSCPVCQRVQRRERDQEDVRCRTVARTKGDREGLPLALREPADLVRQWAQESLQAGKRHLRLEGRAGGAEHGHTELVRASPGLAEQGRLADCRLAPNQERSTASADVLEEVADQRKLTLASEELR